MVYKSNYCSLRERGGGVCDVVQRAPVCTSGPFSTNDDVMDNMARE